MKGVDENGQNKSWFLQFPTQASNREKWLQTFQGLPPAQIDSGPHRTQISLILCKNQLFH